MSEELGTMIQSTTYAKLLSWDRGTSYLAFKGNTGQDKQILSADDVPGMQIRNSPSFPTALLPAALNRPEPDCSRKRRPTGSADP